MNPAGSRTRVLYIMGAGRSGSTALGIALDNVPSVYFGGELSSWSEFRGRPFTDDEASLRHWERFLDRIPADARMFGSELKQLEHHSALLRPWRFRRAALDRHRRHNAVLVEQLAASAGADVVVDSSHYPLRAWLLHRNPAVDLRVVHLVRDPLAIVNALQNAAQRRRPMHPLLAVVYCWVVSVVAGAVKRRLPPGTCVTVTYEDFVGRPHDVVGSVLELADVAAVELDFGDLAVGEVFQGNRLRLRDRLAIEPQPVVDRLSPAWRSVASLLLSPLRRRRG